VKSFGGQAPKKKQDDGETAEEKAERMKKAREEKAALDAAKVKGEFEKYTTNCDLVDVFVVQPRRVCSRKMLFRCRCCSY
jgi:hypothetical protein